MKAAVLYEAGDIRIEEMDIPKTGSNDILIKVKACGICGSDLPPYKLGIHRETGIPVGNGGIILGHEYAGEVVKIGEQVKSVKVGDRIIGVTLGGGMAEYARIPAFGDDVFNVYMGQHLKIPAGISYEEAATIEPLAISLHAVKVADPKSGNTVLIVGAGVIGLGILQVIKAVYPGKVIVADTSQKRLEMAKLLGADVLINPAKGNLFDQVMQNTGPLQPVWFPNKVCAVDIAFDCVGTVISAPGQSVISQLLMIVREGAKVVLVGAYQDRDELTLSLVLAKELRLLGSIGFLPADLRGALELVHKHGVNRKAIVSHEFPLDQAKRAFETQVKTQEAVKVLVKP